MRQNMPKSRVRAIVSRQAFLMIACDGGRSYVAGPLSELAFCNYWRQWPSKSFPLALLYQTALAKPNLRPTWPIFRNHKCRFTVIKANFVSGQIRPFKQFIRTMYFLKSLLNSSGNSTVSKPSSCFPSKLTKMTELSKKSAKYFAATYVYHLFCYSIFVCWHDWSVSVAASSHSTAVLKSKSELNPATTST